MSAQVGDVWVVCYDYWVFLVKKINLRVWVLEMEAPIRF